jgi:hypothetical protein
MEIRIGIQKNLRGPLMLFKELHESSFLPCGSTLTFRPVQEHQEPAGTAMLSPTLLHTTPHRIFKLQ